MNSWRPAAGFISVTAPAIVILSAAYVRDVTVAIQAAFPGRYVLVVGGSVVAAIAIGLVAAMSRIREQRARRYGALLLALGIAAAYFAAFRTGTAEVDAVEAFHFLEYGGLAFLFHRACRHYPDARRIALPLLAGLAVATVDEALQWFLASRVGEVHDVALDLVAVSLGLLVALAVDPPPWSVMTLDRGGAWHIGVSGAAALVLLAAFLYAAHVGYEIRDPEIGTFQSRFDAATLRRLAGERARTWRDGLPQTSARFAREDQYLSEALWHVAERNEAVEVGDTLTAWRENRILEEFYAPLLDTPAVNGPYRWPPEQRALMAAAAARAHDQPYVSRANPLPIWVF